MLDFGDLTCIQSSLRHRTVILCSDSKEPTAPRIPRKPANAYKRNLPFPNARWCPTHLHLGAVMNEHRKLSRKIMPLALLRLKGSISW